MADKLKMIDLCAGTGAFSYAFESTKKVDVIFANDIEKSSKTMYDENFNNELTLGDICKLDVDEIPEHDILTGGFPCFITGTLVLTQNGYKNIENVNLKDKLLTHTGNFEKIVNLQKKKYEGDLYNIDLKYHPNIITCTEEHPFYIREQRKKYNSKLRKYEFSFDAPKWICANKLTSTSFFGMSINNKEIIPEFTFEKNINKTTKGDVTIKLDTAEQWFTLGYFLGDGWIEETKKTDGRQTHKIRFAINEKDEKEVVEKISKILPITDKKCDTGKCKKFGCANFEWYNIFSKFGKYAHGKKIPEWVQDAPKHFIQNFVDGYMKADGCINKDDSHQITTVSYDLAMGMQRLYLKLGHIFGVNKCIRPKKCIIDGREVNQRDTYCVRGRIKKINRHTFIEGNYVWYKCNKISINNSEKISVYNFEVNKDNSYVVENTIVHNCQPFSIAGKQKGFDDPRSNVFWKIMEIIKHHKPQCVVLENVKNLVSHDNGDTLKTIISSLEKEKYHVIYKILNTSDITNIPQHRERIYIVCLKNKKIFDDFNLDFPKIKKLTITKLLTKKAVDKKYYYNDDSKIHNMVKDAVKKRDTVYQFRRIYVRENKSNECPTLTSNMGTGGHNVPIILDDDGARKLTPRECFNFQGFPETYKLPKLCDGKLYKLAGNAVSIPVVKLIADRLVPILYKKIIKDKK